MSLHVVVGAGPIGSGVAQLLADSGEQVRIVTRRGTGPQHPAIERVAADATDADRLGELAAGATAIYNCANPPYHRWPTDWPPPHAAAQAGQVKVTEVRGSDYLGPGASSMVSELMVPALLKGRTARLPADLDAPHSFTYTGDMARTLVTVATDERAWGRAWHVPTDAPVTMRELADRICRIAGLPAPKLRRMPYWLLWTAGLFSAPIKELREVRYQFQRPFVLDSTLTRETFGLAATPLDEALRATLNGRPALQVPW